MKVLFVSLIDFDNLDQPGIYTDLLCEFVNNDHEVTIISPVESGVVAKTEIIRANGYKIVKVSIPKITKQNFIIKGINTLLFPYVLRTKLKKVLVEDFDLLIYPTPPTSIYPFIKFVKKNNKNITTFLLLKDIFPQNAVDLNFFQKGSILYRYFRSQEKKLYNISDFIGCMSLGNKKYLLENNQFLQESKITIVPNSIDVSNKEYQLSIEKLRKKWGIPRTRIVIAYTGNLGKPQSIDFLLKNLHKLIRLSNKVHFVICGSGTEQGSVESFSNRYPELLTYLGQLSPSETEEVVQLSNYGLLILDHRFSIPNWPSRMLTYMKLGKPILAYTDKNTDLGEFIHDSEVGLWWPSINDNLANSIEKIINIDEEQYRLLSKNSRLILENEFSVEEAYSTIMRSIDKYV